MIGVIMLFNKLANFPKPNLSLYSPYYAVACKEFAVYWPTVAFIQYSL